MSAFLIMTACDLGAAYAECDQIVETLDIARREANDLAALGYGPIRVYQFHASDTETAGTRAQNYVDEKDTKWPAKAVARVALTRGI